MRTGRVAAVAAVVVAALVVAAAVLQPVAAWQSRVEGRLVAREPSPYVQEVLGRTAVVRTFGQLVAEPRLASAAAASAGIAPQRLDDVEVVVRADGASSVLVVLVTGRDRDVVAGLAQALLPAAATYLDAVAPLYRLEPGQPAAPRRITRTRVGLLGLTGA